MARRHGKKLAGSKSKKVDVVRELANKGKIPVIKKEIKERLELGQEGPQIRDELSTWHGLLQTSEAMAQLGFTFSDRGVSRKPRKRVRYSSQK